ncbi:MAG: nucleoside monophosphate kinase [Mollicutes bacterium]|nr:nucleoside monophosphate kinase [Mollicutes bacterium]
MKNVVFIAPPAAGKGTHSNKLKEKYGYEHISTGDLLRNEINNKTEIGKKVKAVIDAGNLVEDDIIIKILESNLKSIAGKLFVLDGFPRNLNQAKKLTEIFKKLNIDYEVIFLLIDEQEAMKRTLGRIVCSCGKSYNIFNEDFKPKVEGICDVCNSKLVKRDDDNEESFKVRFQTFLKNNEPILEYYKKLDKLNVITVNKHSKFVFEDIEEVINGNY